MQRSIKIFETAQCQNITDNQKLAQVARLLPAIYNFINAEKYQVQVLKCSPLLNITPKAYLVDFKTTAYKNNCSYSNNN